MTKKIDSHIDYRDLDLNDSNAIAQLAFWSSRPGEMLPLSAESIARHQLSSAAYIHGELAGYAAISVIYSRNVVEFGALIVNPELRSKNVGAKLTKHVITKAREEMEPNMILGFANERSAKLFTRLGGIVVSDIDKLPQEVWKLCHICPRRQTAQSMGKRCCERVFDLTDIQTE